MEWNLSWVSVFPRLPGNFQLLTLLFSLNKIELVLCSIKKIAKRAKTQKMSSFVKAWQIPSLLNLITSTLIFPVSNFLVQPPFMQTPPWTCGKRYSVEKRRVLGFWRENHSLRFWNRDVERWSSQKNLSWGSSCQIALGFPPPFPAGGIHGTAPLSVKAEKESNNCKVNCANPENSLRRQQNLNTPLRLSLSNWYRDVLWPQVQLLFLYHFLH